MYYAVEIILSRFSCLLGVWVIEEVVPNEADSTRTYDAIETTMSHFVYLLDLCGLGGSTPGHRVNLNLLYHGDANIPVLLSPRSMSDLEVVP